MVVVTDRVQCLGAVAPWSGVPLNLQMSETCILIRLLRMHFPRNWEFGSALSKLRNFEGWGVWTPLTPPPPPYATVFCGVTTGCKICAESPACCCYHKDKRVKPGNFKKTVLLSRTRPLHTPFNFCCTRSSSHICHCLITSAFDTASLNNIWSITLNITSPCTTRKLVC
jgi:hypothetical protein